MPRDLHVTSPMMRGADVAEVQSRLTQLGYTSGIIDGVYGPTTAWAVRAFQRANRLAADGVVGPRTRAALDAAPQGEPMPGSPLGRLALAEAHKHIGKTEQPRESNRTEFGRWFGVDGVPWCNIFVSYCFAIGANYIIVDGYRGAGAYPGKGCAYVPTTAAWLRATGVWLQGIKPLPGDIVIYDWDGGHPDHIGIVVRALDDGYIEAVEGNTSEDDDSNGGGVMLRTRHEKYIEGYGRIMP